MKWHSASPRTHVFGGGDGGERDVEEAGDAVMGCEIVRNKVVRTTGQCIIGMSIRFWFGGMEMV